jgi:large subunit ribosomal protein MRP49
MNIDLSLEQPGDLPPIAEHQPVEFACPAAPGARLALSVDGVLLDPFLRPGEATWRWRWNPGAAVGLHQLALAEADSFGIATRRSWALRVVTRKVDQERYQALLEDIQRAAYGVLSTLAGASAEGAQLQREAPWRASPAEEYYALFEQRLASFARAVRRVAARPREQLRGAYEQQPLSQAAELGARALTGLARGPFDAAPPNAAPELQEALRPGGGLLPREVATERDRSSADIYEHRLLKHLLGLLLRRARFVGALAQREAVRLAANEAFTGPSMRRLRAEQIADGSADAARALRELRALPFLSEVQALPSFRGATPLLQRDPAYREVYHMWQALRQDPYVAFDSPLFAIPIADLPHLYESWCAIQVARALLDLGGLVRQQRLVEQRRLESAEDHLEYAVALAEQAPLLVIEHGELALTLRYQPHYRPLTKDQRPKSSDHSGNDPWPLAVGPSSAKLGSLDRHTRVPDLAIEIRRESQPPRVLLLDAKYRLDADGRGVPQDALADAYAYFGAIGCAGKRATLGALLLYPGTGAPERYASGVGTIPLLPGRTAALAQQLGAWLGLPE